MASTYELGNGNVFGCFLTRFSHITAYAVAACFAVCAVLSATACGIGDASPAVTEPTSKPLRLEPTVVPTPAPTPTVVPTSTSVPVTPVDPVAQLCELNRQRTAAIDAVILEKDVDANERRLTELTFEMVGIIDEFKMTDEIGPLDVISDTAMHEWCRKRVGETN